MSSSMVDANNMMDPVFEELLKTLPTNSTYNPFTEVTDKCYNDTVKYMVDMFKYKTYAREMYHSCATFQDDLDLTWNLKDYGNFDMCRQVKPDFNITSFGGKYCLTMLVKPAVFWMGVCYPATCTDEDIKIMVRQGNVLWSYITLCCVLLLLIIIGTVYDIAIRYILQPKKGKAETIQESHLSETTNETVSYTVAEESDLRIIDKDVTSGHHSSKCKAYCVNVLKKGILAFSVLGSADTILNTDQRGGSISCLNGIRVLSMFWIILFHLWVFVPASVGNPRYISEVVSKRWATEVLIHGDLGVEAFLVLSGLLVTYLTLRQLKRCGGPRHYNWGLFYFHRYWRLTPVYAFTLMMYTTLTIHMGDGVSWKMGWTASQEICQERWWANMLYIHNLYPFPGNTSECMGWTWYLSLDMQLFILSPIFILTFYKSWIGGVCLSTVVSLCSFAVSAYLATVQGMTIGGDPDPYREPLHEPGDWLYSKPYYRISQYLVGICLGYVLFKLDGKKVKINKYLNVLLWFCAAIIAVAVVYGTYGSGWGRRIPQWAAVTYTTLHRFSFSLAIAWVIYACSTGNGGPVNTLLSWKLWLPLARLNYSAYLVHLGLIFMYLFGLKSLWFYTDFHFSLEFMGFLVLVYAVAFIVASAVELPTLEVEKVVIPSKNKKA
ncbi:nose resistant to fluoxetine protein 6-like [Glandiceps talaboti]